MRIGTTSFVHPGGWLFNVERLCRDFDDVEILFFEDGPGAFPDADERRGLLRCKREHGLTYSLHAPLSASLASEDPNRRRTGVESVLRRYNLTSEQELAISDHLPVWAEFTLFENGRAGRLAAQPGDTAR